MKYIKVIAVVALILFVLGVVGHGDQDLQMREAGMVQR